MGITEEMRIHVFLESFDERFWEGSGSRMIEVGSAWAVDLSVLAGGEIVEDVTDLGAKGSPFVVSFQRIWNRIRRIVKLFSRLSSTHLHCIVAPSLHLD